MGPVNTCGRHIAQGTIGTRKLYFWFRFHASSVFTGAITLKVPAMIFPRSSSTPPTEFAVVGESKDDPQQLLLLGSDGNYYAYGLADGNTQLVEPDDHWSVENESGQELFT
jgi:hypothetical protein